MILYILATIFTIIICNIEDVPVQPFNRWLGHTILGIVWPITLTALIIKWIKELLTFKTK